MATSQILVRFDSLAFVLFFKYARLPASARRAHVTQSVKKLKASPSTAAPAASHHQGNLSERHLIADTPIRLNLFYSHPGLTFHHRQQTRKSPTTPTTTRRKRPSPSGSLPCATSSRRPRAPGSGTSTRPPTASSRASSSSPAAPCGPSPSPPC